MQIKIAQTESAMLTFGDLDILAWAMALLQLKSW